MWTWIWLAVVALSLIIEFISMELISIWFAGGGLIALICSFIPGASYIAQIIVFIVLSLILLLSFRKMTLKLLNKADGKSNVELNYDKTFKLLTDIVDGQGGTIKINGVVWNAVTEDESNISAGTEVVTVRVEGNKYVVKLKEIE